MKELREQFIKETGKDYFTKYGFYSASYAKWLEQQNIELSQTVRKSHTHALKLDANHLEALKEIELLKADLIHLQNIIDKTK